MFKSCLWKYVFMWSNQICRIQNAFFFFCQVREGGWWNCGHQHVRMLTCVWERSAVYAGMWKFQVWLLYVELCGKGHLTYGATAWGERVSTQSDFATSLMCIKEKSPQRCWHRAFTFQVSWESPWCPFSYVSFCLQENRGFRRGFGYAKILNCHWLFKIFIS